jgi:NTP pyrophosphatase (non-canonical NTP hydrolase)
MALAKTEKDVLLEAITVYGAESQIVKAIEELAELIKALAEFQIGKGDAEAVAEEIADVRIMLEQVEWILRESRGISPDVIEEYRRLKIARLQRRLAGRIEIIQKGQTDVE